MADQNANSSILSTGLDWSSRLESGSLGSGAWNDGTKEPIADFTTLGESVLELGGWSVKDLDGEKQR